MLTVARILVAACLSCGWAASVDAQGQVAAQRIAFGERNQLGAIQPAFINEASGLAASRRYPGMYWVHNDNGRYPGLFLIDAQGLHRATVQLEGALFQDWEDLAAVTLNGESHLVVADCGDNRFRRESCRLFVVPEPNLELDESGAIELSISNFDTLQFRYPDGPRDCESVAADSDGNVFLLTKRHQPEHPEPAWYTLSLNPEQQDPVQTATRLASSFSPPLVTGMDIAPNGRLCVVRSYGTAWLFHREANQSWGQVIRQHEPVDRTLLPIQLQGEAVCFTLDNSGIIVTSEGRQPAIWKVDVTGADHR